MGVTRREYYARRAVECALAADQIPCDRTVLLHMAATYVRIAADVESRQASRRDLSRLNVVGKDDAIPRKPSHGSDGGNKRGHPDLFRRYISCANLMVVGGRNKPLWCRYGSGPDILL